MQTSNEKRSSNHLAHSTSPYLLQHANNPVDWYEWGPEALEKAANENKPLLVSIGYSSCHWCHVMERESFENPDIAALMNEHLVCIKVDREERPDIDQIYMDAVQAMGLNGGWPLNVFITPDQKPFYGGTYFPSKNWAQLILQLSKAFQQRRSEIDKSAGDLAEHLNTSDLKRFTKEDGLFNPQDFESTFAILESKFDSVYGGLDKAPKFVMPTIWMWLLRYHHLTENKKSLDMVLLTLRRLAMGGIYDQIGGGFSRYSVDGQWFAPHFEKMLYDNGQLLSLYSEAYRVSPDPRFRQIVYETIEWLRREMRHPDGGYYSAIDADSEGSEGKFYTWTKSELDELLGDRANRVNDSYQVTEEGNWEHGRNILFLTNLDRPEKPGGVDTSVEEPWLTAAKKRLLHERSKRVRPGLDDKVVAGWNAMLIQGFIDAYNTFEDSSMLEEAIMIVRFMEKHLMEGLCIYRTFKIRHSDIEGFLEDYAFLINAYISLYQSTFEEEWLARAEQECLYVLSHFWDGEEGFFYFAGTNSEKLIARKKEIFDNVVPSSNSMMARNLFRLGVMLDREDWKQHSIRMASSLKKLILTEPSYMAHWGILALEITHPFYEIVITGASAMEKRAEMARRDLPFSVILGTTESSNLPLVKERTTKDKTLIHVCFNKTCRMPVASVEEALLIMKSAYP